MQLSDLNKDISNDPDDIKSTGTSLQIPLRLDETKIIIPNVFDTVLHQEPEGHKGASGGIDSIIPRGDSLPASK